MSAPTNHEIAGFMPGRLEFEHEVENEAEGPVKDMEFGLVLQYGGDEQPQAKITKPKEEEEEEEEEEAAEPDADVKVKQEPVDDQPAAESSRRSASPSKPNAKGKQKAEEVDPVQDIEDPDELEVKLAMLDIYFSKLDKREEVKELIFDRGLTEYKKVSYHHEHPDARSKRQIENVRKTRGSWSSGTRCLQSCKQLWTLRP